MYEGTWHLAARQAAEDAGYTDATISTGDWIDGFVDHGGRFLTRAQAQKATKPDPERRPRGQREAVTMMIAGNLPVDESLVKDYDVHPTLRRRLNDHLRVTGRIDFDQWRKNAGYDEQDPRARRRDRKLMQASRTKRESTK